MEHKGSIYAKITFTSILISPLVHMTKHLPTFIQMWAVPHDKSVLKTNADSTSDKTFVTSTLNLCHQRRHITRMRMRVQRAVWLESSHVSRKHHEAATHFNRHTCSQQMLWNIYNCVDIWVQTLAQFLGFLPGTCNKSDTNPGDICGPTCNHARKCLTIFWVADVCKTARHENITWK